MTCCAHCNSADDAFDHRVARRDLARYRRKGAVGTTRTLIAAIRNANGVPGASLLDVGGGVGAIAHELLADGAERAMLVDASSAYLAAARDEAQRRNTAERVEARQGDFVELAPDIPPADIVTLDRVICCYPDMDALVAASAGRARRLYGAVYPRDSWWMRLAIAAVNVVFRLRRSAFRVYVFPNGAIDAAIRRAGFVPVTLQRGIGWVVAVHRRVEAGP